MFCNENNNIGDGKKLYHPIMTDKSPTETIDIDVTRINELKIEVGTDSMP